MIASLDPVQEAAEPETVESAQVNLPRPEGLDRTYRPQALEVPVLIARDGPIAAIDPGLVAPVATRPESAVAQAVAGAEAVSYTHLDVYKRQIDQGDRMVPWSYCDNLALYFL